MAPSCVMLDADVRLVAITGEKTLGGGRLSSLLKARNGGDESWGPPRSSVDRFEGGREGGGSRLRKGKAAAEYPKRPKRLSDWMREGTIRVGTDDLVRAPGISTLSLHLPAVPRDIVTQLPGVSVKSADKDLLVLSTGTGSLYNSYASSGCYLVYDASADALFLAPPIDCGFSLNPEIFGRRPVVMRFGHATCDFILCLVAMSMSTKQYYLLTWSPALSTAQQWMCKDVCLPSDVVKYPFMTDIAFAYRGRFPWLACWVDLNLGVLTCDVLSEHPTFQLKLLPEDYVMDYAPMVRGRRDGHSTMGCGHDGKIKFVYMDGFVDDMIPMDLITIKTWTLEGQVPHLCTWARDDHNTLMCKDLWADESFIAIPELPKCPPTLPTLSPNEPDVVYFFMMSDIGYVNGHDKTKGEHVLGLNLRTKKVHTWRKCPSGRIVRPVPSFIATELSPSQESSNLDDQGNATHKGAGQKRRKQKCAN